MKELPAIRPTKFNMSRDKPKINYFISWITFDDEFGYFEHNNYYSYFNLTVFSKNNSIKINITMSSNPGKLTGVKLLILVVSERTNNGMTA